MICYSFITEEVLCKSTLEILTSTWNSLTKVKFNEPKENQRFQKRYVYLYSDKCVQTFVADKKHMKESNRFLTEMCSK